MLDWKTLNPTDVYAICMGGALAAFFIAACVVPHLLAFSQQLVIFARKLLLDRFLVNRHRLVGPWTVRSALSIAAYVACNVLGLWLGARTTARVASRAGHLALVNAAPLFLAGHLSFLADLLGVRLRTYRLVHRACGLMATADVLLHGILATVQDTSKGKASMPGTYESTAAGLTILLVIFTSPFLRRRSYELFLRLHQALAVGVAFCTIMHILSTDWTRWPFMYAYGSVCSALTLFQVGGIVYRNKQMGKPWPRLSVVNSHGSTGATIYTSRPLKIDAGQWFNVWVPSVSFLSSHPFTVTSWSSSPERAFELLIQTRDGFTKHLLRRSEDQADRSLPMRVLFSGPHGFSAPVWDFECVLFFVSNFGIAAVLPYLRKLMHGRMERKSKTRRVRLVWHVDNIDLRLAVAPIIDGLFDDDRLDGSYMLYVSIYNGIDMKTETTQHQRYSIHPGTPDVYDIMRREAMGDHVHRPMQTTSGKLPVIKEDTGLAAWPLKTAMRPTGLAHGERTGKGRNGEVAAGTDSYETSRMAPVGGSSASPIEGRTLVLVSAKGMMRDQVRRANRAHLSQGFELVDLDYQPE